MMAKMIYMIRHKTTGLYKKAGSWNQLTLTRCFISGTNHHGDQ